MATEIELKYFVVNDNIIDQITTLLTNQQIPFEYSEKIVANCYFDTPDLTLRSMDMGLRVRTVGDAIEQTIKTKGQIIGGLHQRGEYNVAIDKHFPELSLFPTDIWLEAQNAKSLNISALQAQLQSLFSTNFTRTVWLITLANNTVVELVFDLGTIASNGESCAICEIELELVSGSADSLFNLAELLAQQLPMRPGIKSKAARGYALYQREQPSLNIDPLELVALMTGQSVKHAFLTGLHYSLERLQLMVDAYIDEPSWQYLSKITELLALIRHGFCLFQDYLPDSANEIPQELQYFIEDFAWLDNAVYFRELMDKTGYYRKKLENSQQLIEQLKLEKRRLPQPEKVIDVFYSSRFNILQLALLKLLLAEQDDEAYEPVHAQHRLSDFAQMKLSHSLAAIQAGMDIGAPLSSEQYLRQRELLLNSLLTGSWFGSLYEEHERIAFRAPWLDIKQGISELQTLWLIKQQLQALEQQPPAKLLSWLEAKIENLLLALDHSRHTALQLTPYWQ